ncbi:MAG: DUF4340 domain-containing protein, partial [Chitinivibrionales bacterium]|nr:DUF4340 domain-containing protein [Chitinivibrionales bacterium]MBD3357306.1 DUF4340 domain-containing protein [Chitinivibrionales bacterium]
LLVLLLVVVGIIVLTENIDKLSSGSKKDAFLPGYSEDNVSAFMIVAQKDSVKIRRKGDIWVVDADPAVTGSGQASGLTNVADKQTGADTEKGRKSRLYPADSAAVATALEKMSNLSKDDLVSTNPEKQELFEVDSANGVLVKVWDAQDKPLGSFRIGKSGPDWSSNYVRKIGSDKVYTVGGSIKYSFFSDEQRWRDKTVQKFDKNNAKSITLVKGTATTIKMEKEKDSTGADIWKLVSPEKHMADLAKVNKLLGALSNLKTTGWEENVALDDDTLGFSEPELVARVTLGNGDTKEIVVGNKKGTENKFWVKAAGKEATFLVADHTISKLDVNVEELKASPEENVETGSKES